MPLTATDMLCSRQLDISSADCKLWQIGTAHGLDCICTAGEVVLHIRCAEDLRRTMRTMGLTDDEWAVGEEWLTRLCERRDDGSIRMPGDLDSCSRAWHLGAILGDGHISTSTCGIPEEVVHIMQVRNMPFLTTLWHF